MRRVRKTSQVTVVAGRRLDQPIEFAYEYDLLEPNDPVEPLTEEELRRYRNTEREQNAAALARARATDSLKREIMSSTEYKRAKFLEQARALGIDATEIEALLDR